MKSLSDQRRLYALAAVLLVLAAALCVTWGLWQGPSGGTDTAATTALPEGPTQTLVPLTTLSPGATATAPGTEGAQAAQNTVNAVAYFQDNNGYLVPVMRAIPNQPGIAKATLAMMVQNPANDMAAARLGLRTVLPEGTTIDLDIADSVARIDLSAQANALPDAASEANMINAVVQTLTEYPTVKSVRFLFGGQAIEKLKHGTSVSGDFTRGMLNLESSASGIQPSEARTVTLYFPGETGSLIVPVTRMVYGAADLDTAVLELTKGPSAMSPLSGALPAGCGLIGVENSSGAVTVNFTKEFIALAEQADGGRQALKALALTCAQFDGVKSVQIQVEGEPYDPGAGTLALPTFVNIADQVVDQFIQTQSAAIFEVD